VIFRVMLIFGFASLLAGYAWLVFVAVWVAVIWFSFKTSAQIDLAKEQGVVGLQPQPYPDMSFRWNVSVNSYLRGDITVEELEQRHP
jgi:hypothetical protein